MNIPNILFLESNRIWRTYTGGRKLDMMEGKEYPEDTHFAEDWIGSTTLAVNKGRELIVDEGLSKVKIDNHFITLKELCEKEPEILLGKDHVKKYSTNTQFLLKFLDSAIRLHIQCHPTIPFAQKHLNSNSGKTEAYVILGIRDEVKDPYIYLGFQNPPNKEEFRKMIEDQNIDAILSCFGKIPIKPGDVFIVPGGMPHAIGEGVFMIEIMEPTDFAVRIEFERGGYLLPIESRFMNRGIDFALSMFNFVPTSVESIKNKFFSKPKLLSKQYNSSEFSLIDKSITSCFSVKRIEVNDCFIKDSESFYIGIVTKGKGIITIDNEFYKVSEGTKFFIPNKTGSVKFESEESMEIIVTFPPI